MLTISFQTAVIAIIQIFAVGAVGYFLVRKRVVDDAGLKLLSFISINISFPLFIFYQITHFFTPHETKFWWGYPLINISLIVTGLMLSALAFAVLGKKPKDEFLAASSLHNAGYIPLLLAMSLPLGEMAGPVYAAMIISVIGFDLCLWSLGVWLITRHQRPHIEFKRMINPPLISMSGAIILVLLFGNNAIPEVFYKPVKIVGDSAMAMAMMFIGGNLALTDFKALRLKKIAGVMMMKLLVTPTLALIGLIFWRLDPIMSLVVMIQACMPTAVTLSIIGRCNNTNNQDFINQAIFATHVCCLLTIPIFLTLFGMWVK